MFKPIIFTQPPSSHSVCLASGRFVNPPVIVLWELMFPVSVGRELLKSEHLDVSYFAAGIVSHVCCDGAQTWTVDTISRQDVLQDLVSSSRTLYIDIKI